MLTFFVILAISIPVVYLVTRPADSAGIVPSARLIADFQVLLNKERSSANPDHMIYRYLWWDMPDNIEFVNRLLARGFWRDGFDFTNGRDRVWFECTSAMGWTAYRTNRQGKKTHLWLPAKFPQHFSNFLA